MLYVTTGVGGRCTEPEFNRVSRRWCVCVCACCMYCSVWPPPPNLEIVEIIPLHMSVDHGELREWR